MLVLAPLPALRTPLAGVAAASAQMSACAAVLIRGGGVKVDFHVETNGPWHDAHPLALSLPRPFIAEAIVLNSVSTLVFFVQL